MAGDDLAILVWRLVSARTGFKVRPGVITLAVTGRLEESMQNENAQTAAPVDGSGYADDYRVFVIDDGERHWCVERLADEAMKAHGVDSLGYKSVEEYEDDMGPVNCEPVYWSDKITVKYDEGIEVTRTARDWAKEHRGVFCSTSW